MHFGFPLDSSDIDLLDTDLYLLDTDISSKHFVCLQGVLKNYSRCVFKTSSRPLQRNNVLISKTSSRHLECLQDVLRDVFKKDEKLLR